MVLTTRLPYPGLWSNTRTTILDHPSPPSETGDLAYRATFTRESLVALGDSRINKLIQAQGVTLWAGPGGHSVFYPVRNGSLFNLVLLCPDNMPEGTRTTQGSVEEMREFFKDWDPVYSINPPPFDGCSRDTNGATVSIKLSPASQLF